MNLQSDRKSHLALKVAVIDSSPLFRVGVAQALLGLDPRVRVVEGGTASDALRIAAVSDIDIMFLDPALAPTGAQILSDLCASSRSLVVVVLAASEHEEDVSKALRLGARGYVLKHAPVRELLDAVAAVQRGDRFLSSALGARVVYNLATPTEHRNIRPPSVGLTHRELEIVKQVSVGATNKEIAIALGIREKTVKFHMTNIMEKLQVRNRVEAVLAVGQLLKHSA